ncbi:MAG TPA: TIGR00341 family protein [Candidatus Melainabacteria bacterium]|nr:TIGR00341 family protein [Candidatus Melainabacteria bacterium]
MRFPVSGCQVDMSFDSLPYLENVRIQPLFGKEEKDINALRQRLDDMSRLSSEFVVLLSTSTMIATFGLFQNSAAVIIGAMIIAPLMKPLMGLAYGSLIANTYLIRRALITVIAGTLLSVFIAFILSTFLNSIDVTGEIASRTRPNLLDLGVAVFAGAAGAYCQTRKELADTLAGGAIAVALVPPIGVIGIGLALGQTKIWMGATLLYATNLVGITFAAIIVFLVMGYGPIRRAKKSLFVSLVLMASLAIPLALSMRELLLEDQLARKIRQILSEKTYTFRDVPATVMSGSNESINAKQVKLAQEYLVKQVHVPIEFKLRVIPATVVTAIEVTPDGESEKTLPIGKSIDTASVQWDADAKGQVGEGVSTTDLENAPAVDPFFDLSSAQPEKLPSEGSPPELPPRAIPAPMKDPLLPGAIPEKSISAPAGGDVRPLNQAP